MSGGKPFWWELPFHRWSCKRIIYISTQWKISQWELSSNINNKKSKTDGVCFLNILLGKMTCIAHYVGARKQFETIFAMNKQFECMVSFVECLSFEIYPFSLFFYTCYKPNTAQKMKFFIKDFSSKCYQILSFLRVWKWTKE